MGQFKDRIAADMKRVFEEKLETAFRWKGSDYPCSVTYGYEETEVVDAGGFMDESGISVSTLDEYFSGERRPEVGDAITIESTEFIVEREPLVKAGTPLVIFRASNPDGADTESDD